jgi:hypothetical protein
MYVAVAVGVWAGLGVGVGRGVPVGSDVDVQIGVRVGVEMGEMCVAVAVGVSGMGVASGVRTLKTMQPATHPKIRMPPIASMVINRLIFLFASFFLSVWICILFSLSGILFT